ncbi:MAG: hypothetical protein EBT81_06750 [Gammaproteobacteria bacterium]|nr:hypothetical protein [Gammaproteobacteria bacterium]
MIDAIPITIVPVPSHDRTLVRKVTKPIPDVYFTSHRLLNRNLPEEHQTINSVTIEQEKPRPEIIILLLALDRWLH